MSGEDKLIVDRRAFLATMGIATIVLPLSKLTAESTIVLDASQSPSSSTAPNRNLVMMVSDDSVA